MDSIFRRIAATLVAVLAAAGPAPAALAQSLRGAGSTFVQPVLEQWAKTWSLQSGVDVAYDGVGSGAGIERLKAGSVDFAATDAPLKDEELAAGGFMQFPIVAGGIVPVTNIPQARGKRVRLDGETLAQVFAGKITRWNDARIKALNHAFALPDEPIVVVHRGDSSGITYNFTAYLSKTSDGWRETLGTGKTVKWPVGLAAEGNTGLGQLVTATPNSIGYVEYGYALQHEMQIVGLYTSASRAISPTQTTIRNAVESAQWGTARNFNLLLVGIPGDDTWPIAATTWVVLPKGRRASLDFLRWALLRGDHAADALGYTPIPPALVGMIEASWKTNGAATGSAP